MNTISNFRRINKCRTKKLYIYNCEFNPLNDNNYCTDNFDITLEEFLDLFDCCGCFWSSAENFC